MTGWPAAPAEAAFHGPAGEFVLRTEPHSEAHPMALLAQFLDAFGTACGRGAHYTIEADHHYPNEFCVLVGPSRNGRKGSSWGHVRRALADDQALAGTQPARVNAFDRFFRTASLRATYSKRRPSVPGGTVALLNETKGKGVFGARKTTSTAARSS